MTIRSLLLLSSILTSGLIAGLFYGWIVSVVPGLRNVSDQNYVATMQSINVSIVNPVFVVPFMLTPVIVLVAAIAEWRAGNERRAVVLGAAAAAYVVGVLGVTIGGNIPLNDSLDQFVLDGSTPSDLATRRSSYENPWNQWHLVRTIASVLAFGLTAAAAIVSEAE